MAVRVDTSSVPVDEPEFVRLEARHLQEVMPIEREAYPEAWTTGMFREEIRCARSHFYVMLSGGSVIGYGGFWLILDEAHITSVTVRAESRRQGLGRRLLHFLLERAREEGAHLATLEVRDSNAKAQQLYLSEGFIVVGRRKNYYPVSKEDAVVMLLELCPISE
jgi:ribosomal-protein-alanine N-acetyltransferase